MLIMIKMEVSKMTRKLTAEEREVRKQKKALIRFDKKLKKQAKADEKWNKTHHAKKTIIRSYLVFPHTR